MDNRFSHPLQLDVLDLQFKVPVKPKERGFCKKRIQESSYSTVYQITGRPSRLKILHCESVGRFLRSRPVNSHALTPRKCFLGFLELNSNRFINFGWFVQNEIDVFQILNVRL